MKEGFDKMQAKPFSRLESCFVKMQKARHVYTCWFFTKLVCTVDKVQLENWAGNTGDKTLSELA